VVKTDLRYVCWLASYDRGTRGRIAGTRAAAVAWQEAAPSPSPASTHRKGSCPAPPHPAPGSPPSRNLPRSVATARCNSACRPVVRDQCGSASRSPAGDALAPPAFASGPTSESILQHRRPRVDLAALVDVLCTVPPLA